jgi:hypothetical protein
MNVLGVVKQIAFQEAGLASEKEAIACDDRFAALVRRPRPVAYR